ncbi:MAG: type II secretion system F family protein, partial [archaeon]
MAKEKKKLDKELVENLNKKYEEYKKKMAASDKERIEPPTEPEENPPKPSEEIKEISQPKPKKTGFGFFKRKKKDVEPSMLFVETEALGEEAKPLKVKEEKFKFMKKPQEKPAPKIEEKPVEKVEEKKEGKLIEQPKEKKKEDKTGKKGEKSPDKPKEGKKKKGFFGFGRKKEEKEGDTTSVEEMDYAAYYRMHKKKNKRIRTPKRHLLESYLERAGMEDVEPVDVRKKIVWGAIIATIIAAAGGLVYSVINGLAVPRTLSIAVSSAVVIFGMAIIVGWLMIYVFLDLKIFRRKQDVENVLPDFLQLTSANISAGMPIDKALWMAIRPQFGVLSKEIQEVAKATMAGESLEKALHTFTHRYQSPILTRAMNLLLEGLDAGGEMADLLNKIAIDIQEIRLMRKEMSADVMTYVLFITVATVLVAPFLFGLSTQLLIIVQSIISNLDLGSGAASGGSLFSFNLSEETIKLSDFRIFCVTMLSISSFFAAMIISM